MPLRALPAIESGPLRWGFAGAGLMEVIAGALTQGQLPQGMPCSLCAPARERLGREETLRLTQGGSPQRSRARVFEPWEAQMSASFYQSRKNYSVRGGMGSAGPRVSAVRCPSIYWQRIFQGFQPAKRD
jgi:hypothetical protein